jgi:hypothetical protein
MAKDSTKKRRGSRRDFLKGLSIVAAAGSASLVTGCIPDIGNASGETLQLKWQEFFKKNYRLMTQEEKEETVARLERLAKLQHGHDVQIGTSPPRENVLFGYAFNVTRCEGFMECVTACVKENNLDRATNTQYIRVFEMEPGRLDPAGGDGKYYHEVPVENKILHGNPMFPLRKCAVHQSLSHQGHLAGTRRYRRGGL